MSEPPDYIRDGIESLRAALEALDAECANWGEAANATPTEKTFILHRAFLTACYPDVIRHLLLDAIQTEGKK